MKVRRTRAGWMRPMSGVLAASGALLITLTARAWIPVHAAEPETTAEIETIGGESAAEAAALPENSQPLAPVAAEPAPSAVAQKALQQIQRLEQRAAQEAAAQAELETQRELLVAAEMDALSSVHAQREAQLEEQVRSLEAMLEQAATERKALDQEWRVRFSSLQAQLSEMHTSREKREVGWLAYTEGLADLPLGELPETPEFLVREASAKSPEEIMAEQAAAMAAREAARLAKRVATMRLELESLLVSEQVLNFDVLELGTLNEEERWVGPVVLRLLDDWGRPAGSLVADRLRLECSRAGHNVTMVFEIGYERRGSIVESFGPAIDPADPRGGLRRMSLGTVDPDPWLELLPELFDPRHLDEVLDDDGRWDRLAVRASLNEMLRRDAHGSRWRLEAYGGVVGKNLRDVHLEEYDENGVGLRRVFADRLWIEEGDRGLTLQARQGSIMRGDRSAPFLEGRFRIFLPKADVTAWREIGLPGLAEPPQ